MRSIKTFILIILSFFVGQHIMAQSVMPSPALPNDLPVSPAAANFLRYDDIPVDYCTGVPNISLPLYTVKSGKLSLPLSISYHSSGIKVMDVASTIGLGWVLNAGGMITQTMSGFSLPDMTIKPTYTTATALNNARSIANDSPNWLDFWDFGQLLTTDMQKIYNSPRYSYQLPNGKSGVFRFDYLTGAVIIIPYAPLKITSVTSPCTSCSVITTTSGFIITDVDGISYSFSYFPAHSETQVNGQVTTMYLTSIISADQTDTIRLVYKNAVNVYMTPSYTSVIDYGPTAAPASGGLGEQDQPTYFVNTSPSTSGFTTCENVLDSIISKTTIVKITALADRQEGQISFGKLRISNLAVFDRFTGNLLKQYAFNQSYFGSSSHDYRLKLDNMTISGNTGTASEVYSFDYEAGSGLPSYPIDSNGPFSEDYWGYYNGTSSQTLIPGQFVPAQVVGPYAPTPIPSWATTDRTPNPNFANGDMLSTIHYPTGGKTTFTFEPNYATQAYVYNNYPQAEDGVVGGFRIKEIDNYSSNTATLPTSSKTYTYSPGITRTIEFTLFGYQQRNFYDLSSAAGWGNGGGCSGYRDAVQRNVVTSSSCLPLTADNGPPVFYQTVTEFNIDNNGNDNGKTVYNYMVPPSLPSLVDDGRFYNALDMDRGNFEPHLLTKTDYKDVNGQYIMVAQTQNTYTLVHQDIGFTGVRFVPTSSYPQGEQSLDYQQASTSDCNAFFTTIGYPNFFNFYDQRATQELNLLTQTQITDYSNPANPLTKMTNYTYANLDHIQPTQVATNSSTGDTWITQYQYPADFSSQSPYNLMVNNLHVWSPVISQSSYKNSTSNFLQSSITNYSEYNNNVLQVYPSSMETKTGSENYEPRIQFNAYDIFGNTTDVSKTSGPRISYQWGYYHEYPIAECKNATASEFYFQNYEESSMSGVISGTAHTGNNSSTSSVIAWSIPDARSYVISYWYLTTSGWKYSGELPYYTNSYYEYFMTGGTAYDDVRIYPQDAQMTTYTYAPLVGMTSSIDAKGEVTYYEYDNFQRLLNIKDKDGNMIKHYSYHYQGQ